MATHSIAVVGVNRPHPAETVSGDAWTVEWHDGICRISVIDALGHGPEAAAVADLAVEALRAAPELAPLTALQLCDRALAGTRGAAISIASINPAAATLTFAGIGNVEAQLIAPDKIERPVVFRGIIGGQHRTVRTTTLPLTADWLLLIHTDGVSSRVLVREAAAEHPRGPSIEQYFDAIAHGIIDRWGRAHDDATAVLAGPHQCGQQPAASLP